MNDIEKSDSVIVPLKRMNKGVNTPAESVEGRTLAKGNTRQTTTTRTQSRDSVSSGLVGVRKAARKHKQMQFTALLHHVTVDQLRDSYYSLKRQAAPGIDGMTWAAYGQDLERRLEALHRQLHRGNYRARPARRVYIPSCWSMITLLNALTPLPEAGAQCVSSARWDLCEGCRATGIPIATIETYCTPRSL